VAKWKVHGPVDTLRREIATWDLAQGRWVEERLFTVTSFRPDGSVNTSDFYNTDGSISRSRSHYDEMGRLRTAEFQSGACEISTANYFYDEEGRHLRTVHGGPDGSQSEVECCSYSPGGQKTVVRFLAQLEGNVFYGVEGTEQGYSVPGAATMTTVYDERDLPNGITFHDAGHKLLRHTTFLRDGEGKLLSEETYIDEEFPFPSGLVNVPPEYLEKRALLLKKALGPTLATTTYSYDAQGRLIDRSLKMGRLHESRTAYDYGDRDDPVGETIQNNNRGASGDENDNVGYTPYLVSVQQNRFEYQYDAHGNWTERVVSCLLEPNPDFQRSNIERRVITYYPE
jgi:hypothetical protein